MHTSLPDSNSTSALAVETLFTPGERLLGVVRELPAEADPLAAAARLGTLSFAWARAATGAVAAGIGCAAARESHDGGEIVPLLDSVADAAAVEWLNSGSPAPPAPPGPWFGGVAFDPTRSLGDAWRGWASTRWICPEILLWSRGHRCYAAAFAPADRADETEMLDRLREAERATTEPVLSTTTFPPTQVTRTAEPEARSAWTRRVDEALAELRAGKLRKVVLARAVGVHAGAAWNPEAVFTRLRVAHPGCRVFLLRGQDGSAFVGATPELLCTIKNGVLRTEALAGTAPQDDAGELGRTSKDRREHGLVVRDITRRLAPFAEEVRVASHASPVVLRDVVHLRTPVAARLRPETSVGRLVRALHPTPAVGGVPRRAALRFLAEHEGLDRGWYAGPLGWLGPAGVTLAVALRCALLQESEARLFVGAGIVQGSEAAAEWRETELKARAMLGALGAAE